MFLNNNQVSLHSPGPRTGIEIKWIRAIDSRQSRCSCLCTGGGKVWRGQGAWDWQNFWCMLMLQSRHGILAGKQPRMKRTKESKFKKKAVTEPQGQHCFSLCVLGVVRPGGELWVPLSASSDKTVSSVLHVSFAAANVTQPKTPVVCFVLWYLSFQCLHWSE